MRADTVWFAKDLIEKNKRQFQIPVYQRNYDWSSENCIKLFKDVIDAIDKDKKHFIGTIVYIRTKHGSIIDHDLIIDGQQRITTISIMLKAIYDLAYESNDSSVIEEISDYLFNKRIDEKQKLKLKPIKIDNREYVKLMNDNTVDMDKKSNIYLNYQLFLKLINKELDKSRTLKELMYGIRKLEVVEIVLDSDKEDDPQTIFESINSTGLDLSIADLIRNFLLMNEPNQEKLFEEYWLNIESKLNNDQMANFFNDYLNFKVKENISTKNIYTKFKEYFIKNDYSNESMLINLKYYSNFYSVFIQRDNNYPNEINKSLSDLRILNQSTIYPLLFPVFEDYKEGILEEKELIKVLKFFVNYSLRRIVTGVPSNSLRGLYKTLYNRLFRNKENKENYYDTIYSFFMHLNTKDRVPTDEEFKKSLMESNIYQKRNICKFILGVIENENSNEILDIKELTIEHILPQSDQISWRRALGESYDNVYLKYLHTLGNLTITGYNSELSTKTFDEKKKILKNSSKANRLNQDIINSEKWDEKAIINRAEKLSDILLEIYKFEGNDIQIDFEGSNNKKTFIDLEQLSHTKPHTFEFLDEVLKTKSYTDMLKQTLTILYNLDKEQFLSVVEKGFQAFSDQKLLSYDSNELRNPGELSDLGIYFEKNLNSKYKVLFIEKALEEFGFDEDDYSFYILKT